MCKLHIFCVYVYMHTFIIHCCIWLCTCMPQWNSDNLMSRWFAIAVEKATIWLRNTDEIEMSDDREEACAFAFSLQFTTDRWVQLNRVWFLKLNLSNNILWWMKWFEYHLWCFSKVLSTFLLPLMQSNCVIDLLSVISWHNHLSFLTFSNWYIGW
jgi:hypothetical protein